MNCSAVILVFRTWRACSWLQPCCPSSPAYRRSPRRGRSSRRPSGHGAGGRTGHLASTLFYRRNARSGGTSRCLRAFRSSSRVAGRFFADQLGGTDRLYASHVIAGRGSDEYGGFTRNAGAVSRSRISRVRPRSSRHGEEKLCRGERFARGGLPGPSSLVGLRSSEIRVRSADETVDARAARILCRGGTS